LYFLFPDQMMKCPRCSNFANRKGTATLEAIGSPTAAVAYEANFYGINTGQVVDRSTVAGLPSYNNNNGFDYVHNSLTSTQRMSTVSQKLYRLNSTTAKTGLGMTLKVMAGDKLDIHLAVRVVQSETLFVICNGERVIGGFVNRKGRME
jgi:hypothetical protein